MQQEDINLMRKASELRDDFLNSLTIIAKKINPRCYDAHDFEFTGDGINVYFYLKGCSCCPSDSDSAFLPIEWLTMGHEKLDLEIAEKVRLEAEGARIRKEKEDKERAEKALRDKKNLYLKLKEEFGE